MPRFFEVLFCGSQKEAAEKVKRDVVSLAQNALYCGTKNRVKLAKHLCNGVRMKSFMGSMKVVDIVNRFGHSISNNVAEGIETETASLITDKDRVLSDILLQVSVLCT